MRLLSPFNAESKSYMALAVLQSRSSKMPACVGITRSASTTAATRILKAMAAISPLNPNGALTGKSRQEGKDGRAFGVKLVSDGWREMLSAPLSGNS